MAVTEGDRQHAELVAAQIAVAWPAMRKVINIIAAALADERRRVVTEARGVVAWETSEPAIAANIWANFDEWAVGRIDFDPQPAVDPDDEPDPELTWICSSCLQPQADHDDGRHCPFPL